MILSKPDILQYWKDGKLKFDPDITEEDIGQVSIDLLIGRRFTTLKDPPEHIREIILKHSVFESPDLWVRQETDEFVLHPGEFVLAQTLSKITIPNDLTAFVEGRSSLARLGLTMHLTAPKIDPGWKEGNITLEIAHFGKVPVIFRAGIDKTAQLMLFPLSSPLEDEEAYGTRESDTFQGQTTPIPETRM